MPQKDSSLLVLKVPKSLKAQLKEAARSRGHMTTASFVRELISRELGAQSQESTLKNLEAQAMATNAPMAVTINDGGGARYVAVNRPFAEMHGYIAAELEGASVLSLIPAEDQASVREQVKALDMKDHFALISRHVRKDGTLFKALVHFSMFRDREHGVRYSLLTLQDISGL